MLNGNVQPVAGSTAITVQPQGQVVPHEQLHALITQRLEQPNGLVDILATLGNQILLQDTQLQASNQRVVATRAQVDLITQQRDLQAAQVAALEARVTAVGQENGGLRAQVDLIEEQRLALTLRINELGRQLAAQQQRMQLQEALRRNETELAQLYEGTGFNPISALAGGISMAFWGTFAGGPPGTAAGAVGGAVAGGYAPGKDLLQARQPRINQLNREIQALRQQLAQLMA